MKKRIALIMSIVIAAGSLGGVLCKAETGSQGTEIRLPETALSGKAEEEATPTVVRYVPVEGPSDTGYQAYQWVDENGQPLKQEDTVQEKAAAYSVRNSIEPPEAYDLREQQRVTGVKHQGKDGDCWAFAALGSLESNMLTQGTEQFQAVLNDAQGEPDLSERHLAWFTKNRDVNGDIIKTTYENVFSSGGNWNYATATLARWSGIEIESHAEYNSSTSEGNQPVEDAHEYHRYALIKNASHYENNDISGIKKAILAQGAVAASYKHDEAYYYYDDAPTIGIPFFRTDKENATETDLQGNHAILIAGWDDTYAKENFCHSTGYLNTPVVPKQDGAWLVKNSWGTDWGKKAGNGYVNQDGYFWISYEEASLQEFVSYEAVPADTYDNCYSYDGVGSFAGVGLNDRKDPDKSISITGANVFTLEQEEELKAVSFYALNKNLAYTIQVYQNVETSPSTGEEIYSQSGQLTEAGYYTIDLETPMVVKGKMAVAVTFDVQEQWKTSAGTIYLPVEGNGLPIGTYDEAVCSAEAGQSFLWENADWKDVSSEYHNICIKAFTADLNEEDWRSKLESAAAEAEAVLEDTQYVAGYREGEAFAQLVSAKESAARVLAEQWKDDYKSSYFTLEDSLAAVKENYIAVRTEEELRTLAEKVNSNEELYTGKYIGLLNDIALAEGEPWTPIGVIYYTGGVRGFQGIFDGDGHTIRNLNLTETACQNPEDEPYVRTGLFGVLGENGTVRNLSVENAAYQSNGSREASYCGIIAAVNHGRVARCSVTGTITSTGSGSDSIYLGGIVSYNAGQVEQCYTTGTITGQAYCLGGIVSCNADQSQGNGTIRNCYSILESEAEAMGCIVGYSGGTLEANYYMAQEQREGIYRNENKEAGIAPIAMEKTQFASGEGAYQMNRDNGTLLWSQDFTRGWPVFIDQEHGATYPFSLDDPENILAENDIYGNRTYANAGEIIAPALKEQTGDYIPGIRFDENDADNGLDINEQAQYVMPAHEVSNLPVVRMKRGSFNGDDRVTAVDALILLKEVTRSDGRHSWYFAAAQNARGEAVSTRDVLEVLQTAAGNR